jgi:hypothetical protein
MDRTEFIEAMKAYVGKLNNERKEIKAMYKEQPHNMELHHMVSKIGHEVSAIENAIREMERQ